MADRLPPSRIPSGKVSGAFSKPIGDLADALDMTPDARRKLKAAIKEMRTAEVLMDAKLEALNQQVQALLAQFDWTLERS